VHDQLVRTPARVGEWGGHVLVDCDDPLAIYKFSSTNPAFDTRLVLL
jgi:hypothetical protein